MKHIYTETHTKIFKTENKSSVERQRHLLTTQTHTWHWHDKRSWNIFVYSLVHNNKNTKYYKETKWKSLCSADLHSQTFIKTSEHMIQTQLKMYWWDLSGLFCYSLHLESVCWVQKWFCPHVCRRRCAAERLSPPADASGVHLRGHSNGRVMLLCGRSIPPPASVWWTLKRDIQHSHTAA